jgi:alanyl-tRNA synthetase
MQQHTGQHLLSAVFADLLQLNTVSVHFGEEYSTLDLEGDATVSSEKLVRVERRANDVVAEGRPVSVTFEDAAAAKGLRKASDRQGTLRIVSIPELDRSACGGTHVRSTSEVGPILLRSTERVRSSTRVQFLCGGRALDRARGDYLALVGIAAGLSASPRDVPGLVASQAAQLKESEQARRSLEKQLAAHQVAELVAAAPQSAAGLKIIQATGSTEILRVMAQDALKHPRVLFIGAQSDGPGLVVAATEDSSLDAAKLLREALVAVGGKGGGSPRLAQGAAPAAQARDDAIRRITAAR